MAATTHGGRAGTVLKVALYARVSTVDQEPEMGTVEDFITGLIFSATAAVSFGAILLVHRIARPFQWIVVPVFLYVALVPGAWNGVAGDFDATRVESIRHRFANAYALEHMSQRARYRSCNDDRIELADDAKAVCARVMNVASGKPIPGSEHRCGLLGMFSCFSVAASK
jgi:hypothetical protein